jgi:hypothetical protein
MLSGLRLVSPMISDGPARNFYAMADGRNAMELPPPRMKRATREYASPAVRALRNITACNAREYVAQQNALDAPFQQIARDAFFMGENAGRVCGVPIAS